MTRFLNGINRDMTNVVVVELRHYLEIKDIMHMAIKVKKILKRKGCARLGGYLKPSQGWKLNFKREANKQTKPITIPKVVELLYVKKQVATIEEKQRNIT